ncbi:hypothetical protein TNCV_3161231, partial [Trichonephila clavipes]
GCQWQRKEPLKKEETRPHLTDGNSDKTLFFLGREVNMECV